MNLWLIPLFPLVGFLLNGLFGRRLRKPVINAIAIGSVAASFALGAEDVSSLYPISNSSHDTTSPGSKAARCALDSISRSTG